MVNELGENSHHRKSIRLLGYDYSEPGGYFITISTFQHIELFGIIIGQAIQLNPYGIIAQEEWLRTTEIRPGIVLDEFVFMPDHMHAIILIIDPDVGAHSCAPLQKQLNSPPKQNSRLYRPPKSLGSLVAGYKSKVTSRINALRNTLGETVWQRNYYEHIIRSEKELDDIRLYIQGNPVARGERYS